MSISIKRLNQSKYSWLKNSIFYKSLDFLDEDEILNIEYCSKYTKDIKKYLRVINLWGVEYFPKEFLFLFYQTKPLKEITDLVEVTKSNFYEFLLESLFVDDVIHWAIIRGQIDFLKNLYNKDDEENHYRIHEKADKDCILALNNIEILKYLLENRYVIFHENLLLKACEKDLEVLKYVHEKMNFCVLEYKYIEAAYKSENCSIETMEYISKYRDFGYLSKYPKISNFDIETYHHEKYVFPIPLIFLLNERSNIMYNMLQGSKTVKIIDMLMNEDSITLNESTKTLKKS